MDEDLYFALAQGCDAIGGSGFGGGTGPETSCAMYKIQPCRGTTVKHTRNNPYRKRLTKPKYLLLSNEFDPFTLAKHAITALAAL
jgi:hypothetical protein